MRILKNVACQTDPVTIIENIWPGQDEWDALYPPPPPPSSWCSDNSNFSEIPMTPAQLLFKPAECPPAPKKKYERIGSFMRAEEPSPVRKSERAKVKKPLEYGYWKYVTH